MSMFSDFLGQANYMPSVFPLVKQPTEGLPLREVSWAVGQLGGMGREGGIPVHSQEWGRGEGTSWGLCKYLGMNAWTSHSFQFFPTQDEAWRLKRIIQIDLPGHGSTIGGGDSTVSPIMKSFVPLTLVQVGSGGRLSRGEEEVWGGRVVCWIRLFRAMFFRASPFLAKGTTTL